ncbi:MAG: MFS transporter [Pseudomonadales bacterium]|nr:MFS transporter [Pseudomonadales bacterium]
MQKLSPNWPFNPRRIPFFYGWVIWLFSTLGFLFSIPGQTMGMAVFTDPLIDVLGLTRTELSMAYLGGTITSSLFLTRAGRWYDQYGGRFMITFASIALGFMVFFISMTDILANAFGGGAFILILLGYFGVRFFGQGILTSCSRNVLLLWFVRRRGLVTGIRGIFVSFGFSIAPLLIAWLITSLEWRYALWVMAGVVGILFSTLALIFIRDNPASIGLKADGGQLLPGDEKETVKEAEYKTLEQARCDPVFWIYSCSLGIYALFGTALTFHIVSIFSEAGRSKEEAFAYFLPSAVFSTSMNLLASWYVDKHSLKPFLILMLLCFVVGAYGLLHLESAWGFWMLAAGMGSGGGLWGVISNLAYIRFFGIMNLGAISGLSSSFSVFASAVGPAAFALGYDATGDYSFGIKLCMGLLLILLSAALLIRQQELERL